MATLSHVATVIQGLGGCIMLDGDISRRKNKYNIILYNYQFNLTEFNFKIKSAVKKYVYFFSFAYVESPGQRIVLQLSQPYVLDSMKPLFCKHQEYNYEIEVSTDYVNWKTITSATGRSWQLVKFERIPVTFIRFGVSRNATNHVILKLLS